MQSLLAFAAMHQSLADNRASKCSNAEGVNVKSDSQNEMSVAYSTAPKNACSLRFDTDSVAIKIDNCCTRSMTYSKADFVSGTLVPVKGRKVKGYCNTLTDITHQGTIKWCIADDHGTSRDIIIPNSFYVPGFGCYHHNTGLSR
jgi:hypothetical protein